MKKKKLSYEWEILDFVAIGTIGILILEIIALFKGIDGMVLTAAISSIVGLITFAITKLYHRGK